MSDRAYRISKIEPMHSFNCWRDEDLMKCIYKYSHQDYIACSGIKFIAITIEDMEKVLKECKTCDKSKKKIRDDIEWAKKRDDYCLMYECG